MGSSVIISGFMSLFCWGEGTAVYSCLKSLSSMMLPSASVMRHWVMLRSRDEMFTPALVIWRCMFVSLILLCSCAPCVRNVVQR